MKVPTSFRTRKGRKAIAKFQTLMITELFYWHILNMKGGSLPTRTLRRMHLSAFNTRVISGRRQTVKLTSQLVFFSFLCLLLFTTNTNSFILLFKELKTGGKSFIFYRLPFDVTSSLIERLRSRFFSILREPRTSRSHVTKSCRQVCGLKFVKKAVFR